MSHLAVSIFFAVAALLSLQVQAASQDEDVFQLTATSAEEFIEQAAELRDELLAGGIYADLSKKEKARIGSQLDTLQKLYDDRAAGKTLSRKDEAKLITASEEINGILTGDEDYRMVCEMERVVGSNRNEKVCMTVAERRHRREEAAKELRNPRTLPYTQ